MQEVFEGYKTYIFASMGVIYSVLTSVNGQISPVQGGFISIACLIVCALRSALKTERGVLTGNLIHFIEAEVSELLRQKNPTTAEEVKTTEEEIQKTEIDIETAVAEYRKSLQDLMNRKGK